MSDETLIVVIKQSTEELQKATVEKDEILEEIYNETSNLLPNLKPVTCRYPAVTLPLPSPKVTSLEEENSSSSSSSMAKNKPVTLKPDNGSVCLAKSVCEIITLDNKRESLENSENSHTQTFRDTPLFSKNRVTGTFEKSTDAENPLPYTKVTGCLEGNDKSNDNETEKVTGFTSNFSLGVTIEKIQKYLNKECNGSTITKSIDSHINDFKKLNPEFKQVSRQHLELAFIKVLKQIPSLDRISEEKEEKQQEPIVEKKGIAILKKALEVGAAL